ncbi:MULTISPECIES: hypothetical protein [unclassified Streptomyces]|uniref:hypothetical protein n=1 Tax=unclassified Streptomyces TaxID=2593676 RepID=UPI00081DCC51|nr:MULTISPECIES: hypothetical protein [unclassified Streptomyces]MYZ34350.1 hypothetical protein [Streptomyces sp. SID4917]SCF66671.1 hypothetical protein GA0115259_1008416 [Streptomyces sp. MnatMP-M17]
MAVQTVQADTFTALDNCFTRDLAALIGSDPPRSLTPNRFIDLVEEVRDVLADSRLGNFQDASDDLDSAAAYLTDALIEPGAGQPVLLARARTHLRDAIETAS